MAAQDWREFTPAKPNEYATEVPTPRKKKHTKKKMDELLYQRELSKINDDKFSMD